MNLALAILLYPGLGLSIGLGLLFRWTVERQAPRAPVALMPLSADALAGLVSIGLAALALALAPWPLHPAAEWASMSAPLALWLALEGAFLAPLLPGLLAPSPLSARAASREGQLGLAGRAVIWLAIGMALWADQGWTLSALPGRLLIALAALLAFPAAAGVGPFGGERSLAAAGVEEGLDEVTTGLLRFARALRASVLLAVLIVVSLPVGLLRPWVALLMIAALFVMFALALGLLSRALPRVTLPAGLRWCWWRALPLAIAGMMYTLFI